MSTYGRSDLEQAVVNARKVARSAIRLKHSIAADNELNELMPKVEVRLEAMLHAGQVPSLTVDQLLALGDAKE